MSGGQAPSLQARLARRLAVIFLVAIAAAAGGLAWRGVSSIDSLRDQALQAQARDIERHLGVGPGGAVTVTLPASLEAAYARSGGGYLYVVYDQGWTPRVWSSPDVPGRLEGWLPAEGEGFFRIDEPDHGPLYGYVTESRGVRIAVAQGRLHDDALADSIIEDFIEVALWWMIPLVAITLWVGTMTLRTSLAPLTHLSEQAARIGPGAADVRLPEDGLPREILPLVTAVNRALDRLKEGFDLQRRFTADAAHELRTPLAVLTARIDSLEGADTEGLRRDVQRMNRLVEQMLRAARLEAGPLDVTQQVDLRQVAVEAISTIGPIAIAQRREVVLGGARGPVWVEGNGPALTVAVLNLLENALAHTPLGGAIEVEVTAEGAVRVMDEGPGVPPAEREAVFRRFSRGRGTRAAGAGLGLAIVMETAKAHGGSVAVADRPEGGAVFELRVGRTNSAAA